MCDVCKGFFASAYFCRHRAKCMTGDVLVARAVPVASKAHDLMENQSDEGWMNILNRMSKDEIHERILADLIITLIGKDMHDARKPNKNKEARTKAKVAMRRLAKLIKETGLDSALEIFSY